MKNSKNLRGDNNVGDTRGSTINSWINFNQLLLGNVCNNSTINITKSDNKSF